MYEQNDENDDEFVVVGAMAVSGSGVIHPTSVDLHDELPQHQQHTETEEMQTADSPTDAGTVLLEAERVTETPLVYAEKAGDDDDKDNGGGGDGGCSGIRLVAMILAVLIVAGAVGGGISAFVLQGNNNTASGTDNDDTSSSSPAPSIPSAGNDDTNVMSPIPSASPSDIERTASPTVPPSEVPASTSEPTISQFVDGMEAFSIDLEEFFTFYSVSMSGDGTVMVVGMYFTDANGGYFLVDTYFRSGTQWRRYFRMSDGQIQSQYEPVALALSKDGTGVAVGTPFRDDADGFSPGQVDLYQWTGLGWTFCTSIVGQNHLASFGATVSLSNDGTIMAVGSPNNNDGSQVSNVRIYEVDYETCAAAQLLQQLDSASPTGEEYSHVALSDDGTVLAVAFNDFLDLVQVYEQVPASDTENVRRWTTRGQPIDKGNPIDFENNYVSLSKDGSVVAVSSYTGDVRVFEWLENRQEWINKGRDLSVPVYADCPFFYSIPVALSKDGDVIFISNGDDFGVSAYRFINDDWESILQVDGFRRLYRSGMASSDDARYFAVAHNQTTVRVYY